MDFDKLKKQLEPEEGCKLFPYPDNGGTSIGWGHDLTAKGISQRIADLLFDEDVQDAVAELYKALPWVQMLDDVRQRTLADLSYNLGIAGLLEFHHMLASAQSHDWDVAANQLLDSKAAREEDPERYAALAERLRTGVDPTPVAPK